MSRAWPRSSSTDAHLPNRPGFDSAAWSGIICSHSRVVGSSRYGFVAMAFADITRTYSDELSETVRIGANGGAGVG
jgi:hypothetical protein